MYIEWTKHLQTEEEKKQFYQNLLGSRRVLERLKAILEEKENSIDRTEMSIEIYNTPCWENRQAHKNGNRETLRWLKTLINIDKQKLPETKDNK